MDTKQKTRTAQNQRRTRSNGKKTNKKAGLFGLSQKQTKRSKTAPRPQITSEEAVRRREAAIRRRQEEEQVRQAAAAQPAAEEELPEMVFKPNAEEQARIRTPEENKRAEVRRRSAKRTKARKEEAKKIENRPAVTYTDPVPFNWRKLLLQLGVVAAVVLAFFLGISVFFRVEHVVVYGNNAYSAWSVKEASGIEEGENLLTFGSTRASGKIRTNLPYVDTVRIGIKLPDTVNIYIKEFDVAYAIKSNAGEWWLMTSGGKVVEKIDSGIANNYTKVLGVEIESPTAGTEAKAVEQLIPMTQETTAEGETVSTEPVFTITGADKLRTALLILDALELNEIVGEAASINVQSLNSLELMYGTRYQVKLGDSSDMEKKIHWMKQAIAQQNDYQSGILDCSFTTWTDQVGFTPNS